MATVDILSPASLFHPVLSVCVVPVSRKSRPNPCCNALTNAITETSIACYAVLGASILMLVKAVEKVDSLLKIHEVWHFPEA